MRSMMAGFSSGDGSNLPNMSSRRFARSSKAPIFGIAGGTPKRAGAAEKPLLRKATCLFDCSIRVALLHCNTFLLISLMPRTSCGLWVKFAGKSVLVKHLRLSGN